MSDFHGNRTLDDIKAYDEDNLGYLLKNAKNYSFHKRDEVIAASGEAMNRAMQKHGIDLAVAMQFSNEGDAEAVGNAIDAMMQEKGIRVEQRMDYTGEDRWKCGLYIYKDNEIVDFIGAPDKQANSIAIQGFIYVLKTTVQM